MAQGPSLIFDKSSMESLNLDEAFFMHRESASRHSGTSFDLCLVSPSVSGGRITPDDAFC